MKRADRAILLSRVPLWLLSTVARLKSLFKLSFSQYPLHKKGCLNRQPLFILGGGRSGNTLLRSMLMAGGDIAIPPESYVLPKAIRLFRSYNYLPWDQLSSLIISEFQAYKEFYTWQIDLSLCYSECRELPKHHQTLANIIDVIYRHYAREQGVETEFWGDKTPINALYAHHIVKLFPQAHYIHLIRDPRAVVASYLKTGMHNDVASVSRLWKTVNNRLNRYLKNKLVVSYEDLVISPEQTMQKTSEYLGIPYTDKMINHHLSNKSLGDVVAHEHHSNVKKALTTSSLKKWQQSLTENDLSTIKHIINGCACSNMYKL
ncbi:sulfotransferase family protein [Kangiella koreensis]|uniref:Sulfotransferase n=1 Tax=Kangiella koreensis (strain DSM 16069 / JCM 12317 / KCTC 12182 / SW-125) TaxID=523791 RepID=C7RAQ0_KANKD|nr:sulfotransferase [Kangiella koreensis]ACV26342.1 sulfotransferase [Kangiella koreensis DSM 16069]